MTFTSAPYILCALRKEIADKEVARRFNSGFVVIDPVDEGRNVAAGVSLESLGRFAIAARQFLALPSLGAFSMSIPSTVSASAMIRKLMSRAGLDIFIVACGVPDKSEDVIYPQLRKVNQQIIRHLQSNGFTVFESVQLIHGNTGYMAVIAPAQRITSRMLKGPDIFMSNATSQFIKTHRGAYGFAVNGTSIYAIERGRYASIDTALKKLPRKMLKHKDISLSSSRVLVNSVPGRIAVPLYLELNKKLSI